MVGMAPYRVPDTTTEGDTMPILDYELAYRQVVAVAEEALEQLQLYKLLCERQATSIALNEILNERPTIH